MPTTLTRPDDASEERRKAETARLLLLAAGLTGPARREVENQIVVLNRVLARQLARRHRGSALDLEDLEQVALLALVRAVRRFDPTRSPSLEAYAVPTIRGALHHHVRDHGWALRPPRALQELSAAVVRAEEDLVRTLQRTPDDDEVAAHLGCSAAEVRQGRSARAHLRSESWDAPATGHDEGRDHEARPPRQRGAVDHIGRVDDRQVLGRLLRELSPMEREVVLRRYLLESTQQEIGRQVGVGQVQVSRLLRRALARLREDPGGSP